MHYFAIGIFPKCSGIMNIEPIFSMNADNINAINKYDKENEKYYK